MNAFWDRFSDLTPTARIMLLAAVIIVVIGCGLCSLANLRPSGSSTSDEPKRASTATSTIQQPVSRFIFGTNLSPNDKTYQAVTTQSNQNLLQQMHVQMVRMPMGNQLSEKVITQAAQGVKKLNAVPLVNLYDPFDPNSQQENSKIIKIMNAVFGQSTVYYEYGDEDDAVGISAEDYTAAWNKTIPALKQLAPGAQFVGPATYRYTTQYLQTFLKQAHPLPDEISWHEYACDAAESQKICMQRIDNWSSDITTARSTIAKIVGKPLPIIISEWNYAANAQQGDGKASDTKFLVNWTSKALQVLSENQIFASMQYSCTGVTPLISNDTLTPQGQAFMNLYESYVANNNKITPTATATETPTPTATDTPTPTPTPTPSPTAESIPPTTYVPTPTPTPSPSPTPLPTPTPIIGITPTIGVTPTPQITSTPTDGITPTPEVTPTPDMTPTPTDGVTPTPEVTPTPDITPTPTVEATPTVAPPPKITSNMTPAQVYQVATSGPLLYNSTLTRQDPGTWDETKLTGGGGCGFVKSGYQVNMPQRNYYASCMARALSYNNFTFQVTMKITSGSANDGGGLIFRDTDTDKGNYRFRVNLDGSWDCAPLNIGGTSAAIKKGLNQSNVLTVVAQGSDLYFFINQKFITHVTDSTFASGHIGFMAVDWNSNTTIIFKDIKIWQLS